MPLNGPALSPTCRACGYDLTGTIAAAGGRSTASCPECGTTFDPRRPWMLPPWPARWKVGLLMGTPAVIGSAIYLAGRAAGRLMTKGGGPSATDLPIGLAAVVAWVITVLGAVAIVTHLTDRHLAMPEGQALKGGLIALALGVNGAGLMVVMLLA